MTIDQARVINIPAGTDMLIVGNAAIADVTLLKAVDKVIVTGKSYGETNFIALGTAKNQLGEWQVQVIGGKNLLTVQRGMDRQTYSCAPLCQPSARLGDDAKYFEDVLKQAKDHNAQANGLP
ncbi:MAG: pilus assembly protein N-terminal domain-containing protein [Alphaproteobacteria bacterium]|nr:pilus assembly protein N-terminal domain-containing protein [Alphaproteobacteria bacterium]